MGLFDEKVDNANELNKLAEKIAARAGSFDDVINYFNSENINNTKLAYKTKSYTPLQLAIKFNKSFLVRHFLKLGADTTDIQDVCKELADFNIVKLLINNGVNLSEFDYEITSADLPFPLVERFGLTAEDKFNLSLYTYILLKSEDNFKQSLLRDLEGVGVTAKDSELFTPLEASIVGDNTFGLIRYYVDKSSQDLTDILSLAITLQKPDDLMAELIKLFVDNNGVKLENSSIDDMSLFEQLLNTYSEYNSNVLFEATKRLNTFEPHEKVILERFSNDKIAILEQLGFGTSAKKNEFDPNSFNDVYEKLDSYTILDSQILDNIIFNNNFSIGEKDRLLDKYLDLGGDKGNCPALKFASYNYSNYKNYDVKNIQRLIIKLLNYYNKKNKIDFGYTNDLGESYIIAYANAGLYLVVEWLLQNGAVAEDSEAITINFFASVSEEVKNKTIEILINYGCIVKGYEGMTSLMLACKVGDLELVADLLDTTVDVNEVTLNGDSALTYAVKQREIYGYSENQIKLINLLCEHGAEVNQKFIDDYGKPVTVLGMAITYKSKVLFEMFIKYGADVDSKENRFGESPLMIAARLNDIYFVDRLLELGADIDFSDEENKSVLDVTLSRDVPPAYEIYGKLRSFGAKHNNIGENEYKTNALINKAAFFDHWAIETLSQSIDINSSNSVGETALHIALNDDYDDDDIDNEKNMQLLTVEQLIFLGANVNVLNGDGETPLMLACKIGSYECTKALINAGANIGEVTKDGISAFLYAVKNISLIDYKENQIKVIKLLIEKGANINQCDNGDYGNALTMAILYNSRELFELLINAGAHINVREYAYGRTPLLTAVEHGNPYFIERLLKLGADIYLCDKYNRSLLDVALDRGYEQRIEIYNKIKSFGIEHNEIETHFGKTNALIIKAMLFRHDVIEILSQSIDINSKDEHGNTALLKAIHNQYKHVDDNYHQLLTIKKLISLGADVNAQNNKEETALILATYFGETNSIDDNMSNVINALVELGASVEYSIEIAQSMNLPEQNIEILKQYLKNKTWV